MKIADLVKDGKVAGIADIRDETSGRTGQRLVIVLKRDAVAKVVLNNLYKHTQLQENFGANMLALVDGVPRTLTLDAFVRHWVDAPDRGHRPAHAVPPAQGRGARAHPARLPQGARRARRGHRAHPPLRRRSTRPATGLMALLEIDEIQANAILDLQLRRLAALRAPEDHRRARRARGADRRLRGDPRVARAPARRSSREELDGDRRQVRRRAAHHDPAGFDGDMSIEDLIAEEEMVVTITRGGYVKRTRSRQLPLAAARRQGRARARSCARTTSSSTSSSRRRTTGCCSSPTWAASTAPRRTSCPRAAATPRVSTSRTCWRFQPGEQIAQVLDLRDYEQRRATWCSPRAAAW